MPLREPTKRKPLPFDLLPKRAAGVARRKAIAEATALYRGLDERLLAKRMILDHDAFAEELRAVRADMGMTWKELGLDAGINGNTLRELGEGKRLANIRTVIALAVKYARIRHYWAKMLIRYGEKLCRAGREIQ